MARAVQPILEAQYGPLLVQRQSVSAIAGKTYDTLTYHDEGGRSLSQRFESPTFSEEAFRIQGFSSEIEAVNANYATPSLLRNMK
jgi:hypothetical protein